MDRDLYKLWCLVGIAVTLAVFLSTRGQTKSAHSTNCLVALPDARSSHLHVRLVPLDSTVIRTSD